MVVTCNFFFLFSKLPKQSFDHLKVSPVAHIGYYEAVQLLAMIHLYQFKKSDDILYRVQYLAVIEI